MYKVKGEGLAKTLCGLFKREYADEHGVPIFHFESAASIGAEEQLLLDEALDWLQVYDDPDPGIYDPPPSQDTLLRAQFARRANTWEDLFRRKVEKGNEDRTLDISDSAQQHPPTLEEPPSLPPEDWRNAGLILLMWLAGAYYRMLECTISGSRWVASTDIELNHSYLWIVKTITNLLKNHEDLKDFPISFDPLLPDLYPSTIRDLEWADMVAPDAERFLSTVQRYVQDKGTSDPEQGSPAWVFIELFRPSVNAAIERAMEYKRRMHQASQRLFDPPVQRTAPSMPSRDGKMQVKLHTIRSMGHKELPHGTTILLRPELSGTITVELRLPNQQKEAILPNLLIEDGVLVLPVPLVFLCHANEDKDAIQRISDRLWQDGFVTWFDRKDLIPGDDWKSAIEETIERADRLIVFLSKRSVAKTGYFQREIKYALEQRQLRPNGARFIIPALLEDCQVPREFRDIHWLRMWEEGWYEKLKTALRK